MRSGEIQMHQIQVGWRSGCCRTVAVLALGLIPLSAAGQKLPNPKAIPIGGMIPAAAPDVFGGYASDHILVRVRPGVQPGAIKGGQLTFSADGFDAPRGQLGQTAHTLAGVLQKHQVAAINEAFTNKPKNPQLAEQYGLNRYYRIDVPVGSDTPALVNQLRGFAELFEVVELDGVGGIASIPNDSNFGQQWGMDNTGQSGGTPDADIDAPEAWDIHQGSSDVLVAVLDTGIQVDHPDLVGRVTLGPPTFLCPVPLQPQCPTNDSNDKHGHGTHCAGTIGANANNALGIASMNWNCQLLGIRVVHPIGGNGVELMVADAIIYATDNGADIISMSLQYGEGTSALENAVAYAYDSGVLPIAATGNNAVAGFIAYPAKFPKCMAVGATNRFDLRWSGSNFGPEIDVTAPGQDVHSLWVTAQFGGYFTTSGTSMATPHVAGLASLIRSYNPDLTLPEVEDIIRNTADDKGAAGFDNLFGWGRINAHAALIAAAPAPCEGDITGDKSVDVDDLLAVLNGWGDCPQPPSACLSDIAPDLRDGVVDVDDLLEVIVSWGDCP